MNARHFTSASRVAKAFSSFFESARFKRFLNKKGPRQASNVTATSLAPRNDDARDFFFLRTSNRSVVARHARNDAAARPRMRCASARRASRASRDGFAKARKKTSRKMRFRETVRAYVSAAASLDAARAASRQNRKTIFFLRSVFAASCAAATPKRHRALCTSASRTSHARRLTSRSDRNKGRASCRHARNVL